MRHENTLDLKQTALAVIDMQESFRGPIQDFAELAARVARVAHAAQLLGVPLVVTEQYPKGLGRTDSAIRAVLPEGLEPIEKTAFSSCGAREFVARLEAAGARQVLVCGVAAHICVDQTAHDLLARDYQVHLLTDCITARAAHDKHVGL